MAKVNRSLYKIPLVGGIEKIAAIVLTIAIAVILLYTPGIYLKAIGITIVLLMWGVLALLNARDPIFLSVVVTYLSQQKFYYAQAMETAKKVKRKYRFNP